MMLEEHAAVPDGVLPIAAFREHLRLGTGFADIGAEDASLAAHLRAAIAVIEGRTGKVLFRRDYTMTVARWRYDTQPLPVAPVSAVTAVRVVDAGGDASVVDAVRYRLVRDNTRPRLEGGLPHIPYAGEGQVDFVAGFGPVWTDIPADLRQAVLMLAAQYYDLRHDGAGDVSAMPFGVMALIERWRTVRILGGRG